MTAIAEHTEIHQVAARLSAETGTTVKLPSYKQVRTEISRLKMEGHALLVKMVSFHLKKPSLRAQNKNQISQISSSFTKNV
jgi:hypothetical protein